MFRGQKVQREDNSEDSMQFERLRKAALIRYWESIKPRCFKNVKTLPVEYRVYGEQKSMDGGDYVHHLASKVR